jgi:hypothetical protein
MPDAMFCSVLHGTEELYISLSSQTASCSSTKQYMRVDGYLHFALLTWLEVCDMWSIYKACWILSLVHQGFRLYAVLYMGNRKTESRNKIVTGGQQQVVWSKCMQRSIKSRYKLNLSRVLEWLRDDGSLKHQVVSDSWDLKQVIPGHLTPLPLLTLCY